MPWSDGRKLKVLNSGKRVKGRPERLWDCQNGVSRKIKLRRLMSDVRSKSKFYLLKGFQNSTLIVTLSSVFLFMPSIAVGSIFNRIKAS